MKSALVVVDFQNDFCSPEGKGADKRGDLSRLESVVENLGNAIETARANDIEVIFVQYVGDRKYQHKNLIERDIKQGKVPKCLENTWGIDFYKIKPLESEKIIRKYACFDAFLNPEFDEYLRQRGIERLIFSGVYLDICVDSIARTAFQKGYYISVLGDCTESLYYKKQDVLEFMAKYYGAEIVTSRDFCSRC